MIDKLRIIYKNNREIISYLFFGCLTTAVNYVVFFPLYNLLQLSAALCNLIAWFAAVAFAFFTNKKYVFRNDDWSKQDVIKQAAEFAICRIVSGVIETVILFITADLLMRNGNAWKVIVSIFVVIVNYFGSKMFVFSNKI